MATVPFQINTEALVALATRMPGKVELVEELQTKVSELDEALVHGEMDPDEVREYSASIAIMASDLMSRAIVASELADDWKTHINAELDR